MKVNGYKEDGGGRASAWRRRPVTHVCLQIQFNQHITGEQSRGNVKRGEEGEEKEKREEVKDR